MNNITPNSVAVQVGGIREAGDANGNNGFVHSGTSPTREQSFEELFHPTADSRQQLTTDNNDGNAADCSSPTFLQFALCDYCGLHRLVSPYCEVECDCGHMELVSVCDCCRTLLDGGEYNG